VGWREGTNAAALWWRAASSGAVLRLEAEVREELWVLRRNGKKSTTQRGGGDPAGGGRHHPFKVGQRGTVEGGWGKSSDAWRGMRRGGLAPIGGGQLGRRGNDPVTARAGGAGSLTSGARLAVGGHGGERCGTCVGQPGKEMECGEPRENAKAGSG
jgi:hypothetical protein